MVKLHAAIGVLALAASPACAQTTAPPDDIIITAPGGRVAGQTVAGDDLRRTGAPDLFGALARTVPGLSLADVTTNPFQPSIVYHGFTASPLEGAAQGLATYVDGARFNLPFGDTVDLSLIPAVALDRVTVSDPDPVYGLNALGGAILFTTRTGRSAPGVRASLLGGSCGAVSATAEAGGSRGRFSAYAAFESDHDAGWRVRSPSDRYAGFTDIGWNGASAGAHLKLSYGDADLTGNGQAPVALLAADRRAVFTYPDVTRTRLFRATLQPWWQPGAHTRVAASLYGLAYRQRARNGDASDISACDDDAGLLCIDDDPLTTLAGDRIADVLGNDGTGYGVLNRSRTRTDGGGLLVQVNDTRPWLAGSNALTLGGSYDAAATRFASQTDLGALGGDGGVGALGPTIALASGTLSPVRLRARNRYTGLFAVERIDLLRGVAATVSLRWNRAVVRLRDELGTALNGDHRFTRINPQGELEWQATPALTLQASYGEANRAPTPAELSCADPGAPCSLANFFVGDPPLRQVVARNYAAAASGGGDAGGWALRYRLSAYRSDAGNDIQMIASAIPGRAFFANVGGTRRQGVEATLSAKRGGVQVTTGYALTDATFRTPFSLNSPQNPAADADGTIAVRSGDRIASVPRHRGTIAVDYDNAGWGLGADLQAQTGVRYFGDEIGALGDTGAYAVVNLRGHWGIGSRATLFFDVRNLFDAHYSTYGVLSDATELFPALIDPRFTGPGAPRRLRVGLKASF